MAQLCRDYGISRKTGYKWVGRYEDDGLDGLEDRSRAHHEHPWSVAPQIEQAILDARAAHPLWGPRKLFAWLCREAPQLPWPCGQHIDDERNAARAVSLVADFFVRHTGQLTGTPFDCPFYIVFWNILCASTEQRRAQTRIAIGVTPANFRSDRNLFGEAAENLAAFRISRAFLALNGAPFRMAGHGKPSLSFRRRTRPGLNHKSISTAGIGGKISL